MSAPPDYKAIHAATPAVYERQAIAWPKQRSQNLGEALTLAPFLAALPRGGRLLDLGCGTGDPVTRYMIAQGFDLTGIDVAPTMIAQAREQFPQADWHVANIRDLPDLGTFDGVYSWDGFFHLSMEEQRAALPRLASLVRPGGAMLLTVGPEAGEVTGTVCGETVYHASLAPEEYRAILTGQGFSHAGVTPNNPDAFGRSILLATGKSAPPS